VLDDSKNPIFGSISNAGCWCPRSGFLDLGDHDTSTGLGNAPETPPAVDHKQHASSSRMAPITNRLPSGPSAPPLHRALPTGLVVQVVALGLQTAVCGAVEEGFRPIPCRMATDGPPGRAGDPYADAEDKSDQCRGKDADPVFAAVAGVDEAEERPRSPTTLPEPTVWGFAKVQNQAGQKAQQSYGIDAPNAVALGLHSQPQTDRAGPRPEPTRN